MQTHDAATRAPERTDLRTEIARRRTFAIISHPDAGKTTLTEKLLLYGGALHLAGSVKGRRAQRHATSDWMAMEQERGISITASALHFEWEGFRVNLLDTPGHQDFSEDTYRALTAADSAIMLLDNRRGVEEQTRKLFAVCKRRRLPIVTFVNKCDREGADPLQLLDDVSRDLDIICYAATWPARRDGRMVGACDRLTGMVHVFPRMADHGQTRVEATVVPLGDPRVEKLLGPDCAAQLLEDLHFLDEVGAVWDAEAVAEGRMTPVFFGSALTNAGVEVLLRHFLELAPPPAPRESGGVDIDPVTHPFSGFVFKVQANMDPRHRDRIAFVRICSGRYEAGMDAFLSRTGRTVRLATPQELMARERVIAEDAVAGDVVGIHDRGNLRVGDTLSVAPGVEFAGVPRFSPEHFAAVRMPDAMRRKQLDRGLLHLAEEGTILLLYSDSLTGPVPLVGAVGKLQFEVLADRLEREYGVSVRLDPLPFHCARWVTGPLERVQKVASGYGRRAVEDAEGHPMILFESEWALRTTIADEKSLTFHEVQPRRR
ncbi:MAG TPA: peptide chain release factor 3 [Longimicrobiales bacterium]|nr:peptide chain release factor 3 [Longimicrobiales bacterium]